jgi:glutaryl-CoA dehydrogenase
MTRRERYTVEGPDLKSGVVLWQPRHDLRMNAASPRTRVRPNPLDLAGIDDMLSPDEKAVRASVRQLCASSVDPYIADWFESGDLPGVRDLAKELDALGLLGMHLQGYGCAGMSAVDYGLACLELEASDSGNMGTRARRDGDSDIADWVLNGSKMWITNGSVADVAVIWAQTEDGIRGFVVPTDAPGFSARLIKHKLSLRASVTSELVLDNVRLPHGAVFPEVRGLVGPLSCLNEARYGILWGAMGAARSSFEVALAYAGQREQFGRPISGFQLTQSKLAGMAVELTTGTLLALHLGRRKDSVGLRPEQASIGKLNNVTKALEICRTARTILGANGISLEYPVIRHMANLESALTYEGTPEMHILVIGQALTGQAAFR